MTPLTAQQTLARAKSVFRSGGATGLRDLLKLLETLSTDIYRVSLSELSDVIEKDPAVLTRLITVANTLGHNPGMAPIGTITQAIHQVGFNRIRSLAVSIMLLDKTGSAKNPPEQQEASTQALCAGLLAQGCAAQLGTLDPDIAFACAMLRHLGDIVLPAVSLELFRAVIKAPKAKSRDAACQELFGLTPLELSRELLQSIRLPEEISHSLRACHPELMRSVATKFEARLLAVSELGSRLARHALDPDSTSETFPATAQATAQAFAHLVPGAPQLVEAAMIHTTECFESFLRSSGLSSLPAQSLRRLKMHVHFMAVDDPASPTAPETRAPGSTTTDLSNRVAAPAAPSTATTPWDETETEALAVAGDESPREAQSDSEENVPTGAAGTDPATPWDSTLGDAISFSSQPLAPARGDPIAAALTSARDSLKADECWFFRPPAGGTIFDLIATVGRECAEFQIDASVRFGERSVFGLCLSRQEVVALHDANDPKIVPYLPTWWRDLADAPRAVALIPVKPEGAAMTRSLVLIGWRTPRHLAFSAEQVVLVHQLCAHLTSGEARLPAMAKS